ncbi:MAG: S8 family serine peptidase [Polyangiaceae bacterium]|nr:S8 family serine peptidase [Polyangiaceae bacterium]
MRRLGSLLPLVFASLLVADSASAQSWGARLVRALHGVGRTDLIADKNGKIPVSAVLPSGLAAESLGLKQFDNDTASMRLLPSEVIALAEQHPDVEISVGPGLRPLLDVSKSWTGAAAFSQQTGYEGTGVAVGIIDTGVDITHPDFRNADGTTRIKWLLQTGISSGKQPQLEKRYCTDFGLTCGIFSDKDINALLAIGQTGGTFDPTGHGTHVASIAAGNGGPSVNETPRYKGVAPKADLMIGALESFQDDAVSIATQFVFDRADDAKQPCVVNLSLGSDYGAHDGSDILGRRLAALVGDNKPGRAITVAAGNSGAIYVIDENDDEPWGIHTDARVYPHSDVTVPMYAPKSQGGRAFMWITFEPGDDVSVALEGPGGTWVGPVSPGSESASENGKNVAGIVNNKFKPGASLAPVTNGAVVVWSGEWEDDTEFKVRLSGSGTAQMWLTSTGDLALSSGVLFKRAKKQGTINVPASDPALLAVGCTLNRLAWPTVNGPNSPVALSFFGGDNDPKVDSTCYFSSTGPTPAGVPKPEISAPGAFVGAAMAKTADPRTTPGSLFDVPGCPDEIPNCYVLDDGHAITAGTSMSSPHVAGAIALLFEADPTLTQARVTHILQAGARYPQGKVPYEVQLGPGELNLLGALQAMGEEGSLPNDPDPEKSWFVLSSETARPDGSWPVWGTVELRRSNGDVARALDGTFLSLEVTNGVVLQPLRKVRHGMWRFSVAGEEGKNGQSMTVNVRYGGVSIGTKTIVIGNDSWSATEPVRAVGGCAIGPEQGVHNVSKSLVAILCTLSIAMARARRKKRRYTDAAGQ